jgi:hypothetical protein
MMSETTNSINWKNVREELARARTTLFERFVTDPANTRLAPAIKQLDDQILECADHLRGAYKSNLRKRATSI